MSYHYTDIDDRPPRRVPDVLAERNALYVILCSFLSPKEIEECTQEVYKGIYTGTYDTNEKAR